MLNGIRTETNWNLVICIKLYINSARALMISLKYITIILFGHSLEKEDNDCFQSWLHEVKWGKNVGDHFFSVEPGQTSSEHCALDLHDLDCGTPPTLIYEGICDT